MCLSEKICRPGRRRLVAAEALSLSASADWMTRLSFTRQSACHLEFDPSTKGALRGPFVDGGGLATLQKNEAPGNLMLREPRCRSPRAWASRWLRLGSCTEPVMRMHGFTADELAELVRAGFAATATERTVGEWRQPLEVKRFKINEAGERALG